MTEWIRLKDRTAARGTVWRSADGRFYKRTGDVLAEARCQQGLFERDYPVPEVVDTGCADGESFFVERSFGECSLHERSAGDFERIGAVQDSTVTTIADVAGRLLAAQAANPVAAAPWFAVAAFADNVFAENPDFDVPRVHKAVRSLQDRVAVLPMSCGHLDFGLPNMFPAGVIDWQFHGPVPLGYDVYPALEIIPFKGGNKGYSFTVGQRASYVAALDQVSLQVAGRRLSDFLGEFLLVKCFFFLALMRPADPGSRDKQIKWHYRRALFEMGLESYEVGRRIDTAAFPAFSEFVERRQDG